MTKSPKLPSAGKSTPLTPAEKRLAAARKKKADAEEDALLEAAMKRAALERTKEGTVKTDSPGDADAAADGAGRDPEESPEKKKSKQTVETPVRSALKTGRYVRPGTPAPERMHLHEHKRAIIEAGLTLDSSHRFEHLVSAVSSLIKYCQLVDKFFVINPIHEGGRNKDWSDAQLLPTLMMELGAYLKLSGSPRLFDKPKGRNGSAGKTPTVYFSFAMSSDVPTDEIMARVNVDWNILGGMRLAVKSLGVFDTVTPLVIYFLWNNGHGPSILRELQNILEVVAPSFAAGEQSEVPTIALLHSENRSLGSLAK